MRGQRQARPTPGSQTISRDSTNSTLRHEARGLVVDTSAFVEIERGNGDLDGLLASAGAAPLVMPAVVLAELLVGVRMAASRERAAVRQRRVAAFVERVPVVDFTGAEADCWAELFTQLHRAGTPISSNDLAVVATARVLGWDVLVGASDERHFRAVPDLGVVALAADPR